MENQNEATINELGRTQRSTHQENLVGKGMVGGLVCKMPETGLQINVGPGKMKHDKREYYWLHQDKLLVRLSNTRVWTRE